MELSPNRPIISLPDLVIEQHDLLLIAGPCSVESEEQLTACAELLVECGMQFMRGGAYKPRTNPYSFQGMQKKGLDLLGKIRQQFKLKIVTEIVDVDHLPEYEDTVDVLQIGARNMSNFQFLKRLAVMTTKPILLKRGYSATIEELVMAAEYLIAGGNKNVILCERGIRTFEPMTRSTLDIASVPIVKKLSPLPIIIDPSHACGRSDIVIPLALGGLAAGADGLMVEIHPNPQKALCDGLQSLDFDKFRELIRSIDRIRPFLEFERRPEQPS